ncbi:MAG: cytidylate kinase-like family protein [bacterium]|nr:cytidylate kinase-like family protein [bacterium]
MFHLGQIIVLAAREQRTVFVGRGAQFVLPRQKGLTVRLIAPMAQRIERIMERHGFDSKRAQEYLDEADRAPRVLIERYSRRDVEDPSVRDLVINLEHVDHQEAADLIVDLYRRRFGPQE